MESVSEVSKIHILESSKKTENSVSVPPDFGIRRFMGLMLPVVSGICHTLSFVIVKKLKERYHVMSLSFWRNVGFSIAILPFLLYDVVFGESRAFKSLQSQPEGGDKMNFYDSAGLVLVSSVNIAIVILSYYAQAYITVADTMSIGFSGPFFTIILGHLFLEEKCGLVQIPISFWILCGVIVIARPPFLTGDSEYSKDMLIGVMLAIGATLLTSIYFVSMRKYRKIHFAVTGLIQGLVGMVEVGCLAFIMSTFVVPDTLEDAALVAAMGILSAAATVAIVLALKFEKAGIVDLLRTVNIIFTFVFEFVVLGVVPDEFSIIGSLIVVTGVVLIAMRSILLPLPPDNKLRRRCCLLLK